MIVASVSQVMKNFVEQLQCPYGFERSFKISQGHLSDERFLLTFHKKALASNEAECLAKLANLLNMPAEYIKHLLEILPQADIIHLGFEGAEKPVCKIYLEFTERFFNQINSEGAGRVASEGPVLLYSAFKWNADSSEELALTYYHCSPELSRKKIEREIARVFGDQHGINQCSKAIAFNVLDRACECVSAEELMLMQVSEEGNQRRSFDLNLYNAKMNLTHIASSIEAAAGLLNVPELQWRGLLNDNGDKALGHMAAGTGGDGNPFFTFYFGVESIEP